MERNGQQRQGARRALGVLATAAIVAGVIAGSAAPAAAAPSGAITGHVTDPDGHPVEGLCVVAEGGSMGVTDANGTYLLEGMPSGSYTVQFNCWPDSRFVREWYSGATSHDDATPVAVTDGETTGGIDAQLDWGASISGTVTGPGGTPIGQICVNVVSPDWSWFGGAQTAPNGSYSIGSLPAGDVLVQFSDCNGTGNYVEQWWEQEHRFDDATAIPLSAGEVRAGVDAQLTVGGAISGTVTDPEGAPVENVCIGAVMGDAGVAYGTTGADGTYTMRSVPLGEVRVIFVDCNLAGPYAQQWWDHVDDAGQATPIMVQAGVTVTGIDARLERASVITGRVQDEQGAPIEDVCVATYGASTVGGSARTSSDGSYVVVLQKPGAYKVQFVDCSDDPSFVGEWWDDQPTYAAAAPVTVGDEATVTGIDAVLAGGASGTVSGRVTNLAGVGMSTACVIGYVPDAGVRVAPIASDGSYTMTDLAAGEYYIAFFDCADGGPVTDPVTGAATYASVWAPNQPVVFDGDGGPDPIAAGAELVRVAPGADVTLDHCFGCDGITITSLVADDNAVTAAFATPTLYSGPSGDTGGSDEVAGSGFAAVVPAGSVAVADAARDASFTYTATCTSTDGGAPGTATGAATTLTVTGLTAGRTYSCAVTAADESTTIASSSAVTVTLEGGEPAAVTPNQAGAAPATTAVRSDLAATGATGSATLFRVALAMLVLGVGLIAGSRALNRKRFGEASAARVA